VIDALEITGSGLLKGPNVLTGPINAAATPPSTEVLMKLLLSILLMIIDFLIIKHTKRF
jgi:hypothetical protein